MGADLQAKADRWLRALHLQTRAVWEAQSSDIDTLGTHLALAVTAVRVLDREVFEATYGSDYRSLRDAGASGCCVNGMTLMRNAEIHLPVVVEPATNPVLGWSSTPRGRSRHHVFWNARWSPYSTLPDEILRGRRTAARCHSGYLSRLEGREVTETLLDGINFFARIDPTVTPRDKKGNPGGIPPQASQGDRLALSPNGSEGAAGRGSRGEVAASRGRRESKRRMARNPVCRSTPTRRRERSLRGA